jgi:beta-phosphoglucomutase-like phosphatase (HAD superfamily)
MTHGSDESVNAASPVDLSTVTTLLCDADGTLFPSEEPAYVASAVVTQAFAEQYGLSGDFSADHLRRNGTGRNFRALTTQLLQEADIDVSTDDLAGWIDREQVAVTAYLADTLRPDPDVIAAIKVLASRYRLAVVSSSATPRLLACLRSTGLAEAFPAQDVFSAEDSMPDPVSKPDPAIYRYAMATLGITAAESLAIEDSPTGAASAVAAGIQTIGVVGFLPDEERDERIGELLDAGAALVVRGWSELSAVLLPEGAGPPEPTRRAKTAEIKAAKAKAAN